FQATDSLAQQVPPEVAKWGYADTIFINGKVVSMDDKSTSTRPGNIYQALAVKADKILKLGANAEVRSLAGPDTQILDLKGRILLPGIIESHSHIYGGAVRQLERLGFKYPPNGVIVSAQADRDLEKTQAIIRDKLQETIKQVEPGQWVVLNVRGNPEAPSEARFWGFTRRLINRRTIDLWTPDNPVLVNPGLRGNLNSKAFEVLDDFFPGYSESIQETMHGVDIGENIPEIGWVGSQEMSVITWELFLEQLPAATLAEALRITSEEFASLGVTTVSTRLPFPKVMTGYATLAGLGQMPHRLAAHYEVHRMPTEPSQTRQIYRRTGVLQGIGDDYLWIDGVASERWDSIYPESCTGPDTQAPPNIKAREVCPKPGDLPWDVLENALKSGWRLAGVHMCGSESARAYFRMIDRAREVNGMSMEEIRAMHMTTEHCNLIGQQPDVIQKLKDYGIILSCGPDLISEAPNWIADYGPQIEPFILPIKTWIDSGVKVVGQHYGGGATGRRGEGSVGPGLQPPFFQLWQVITRKFDGKVWQPQERIDRVTAMKMWTSWAAEYVTKPDKLGSLEVGKLADLLVIDRDYFTIPIEDILKIRPLMTMVGGRMIVLQESLARDFGIEGVGPSYDFKDEDIEHIGKPLAESAN
ncbi:amidohydrolase family protein, partial [Acidobacteria bacterium AH-259-D05]|nr:amidohydrolase family protein [Acidobacteria bacterium AH-259-D05]